MRIDLHTHSIVSDGTDTPAELIANAVAAGLDVVGLTDHDTFDGLAEAAAAADELGIGFVPGIEISCAWGDQEVHMLGFLLDQSDARLGALLAEAQTSRNDRVPRMVARLGELGFELTVDEVLAQAAEGATVGRPHIADALVARGYFPHRRDAFDRLIGNDQPGYVERFKPQVIDVIEAIHGAGGVAVVAHAKGLKGVASDEAIIDWVTNHDLDGIEVDHQEHDAATREHLRALANSLDVIITGSSDYHGTGKIDHDLGCNTTAPDMLARISERAANWPRR